MYAAPFSLARHGMGGPLPIVSLNPSVAANPFSVVLSAADYLKNIATTYNNTGGMDPATVQAVLENALTNNYCTPQNPDPACHSSMAAATLISSVKSTVKAPSASTASTPPVVVSKPAPASVAVVNPNATAASAPVPTTNATETVASGTTASTPNVAPIVNVNVPGGSWFTDPQQDLIGGIPNWVLLGGIGLVGIMLLYHGGR